MGLGQSPGQTHCDLLLILRLGYTYDYIYLLTYMRRSTWMRAFIMQVSLPSEASNLLATTWSSRVLYVLCMWYGTLHLPSFKYVSPPHNIISISHSYGDPLAADYPPTANPSASNRICRPRTIFVIVVMLSLYPFFLGAIGRFQA